METGYVIVVGFFPKGEDGGVGGFDWFSNFPDAWNDYQEKVNDYEDSHVYMSFVKVIRTQTPEQTTLHIEEMQDELEEEAMRQNWWLGIE